VEVVIEMNHRSLGLRESIILASALPLVAAGMLCSGPVAAEDRLTLRVQDAIAEPGGVVAVVLRTYASRPIGQGQLCLMANPVQSQTSTTEISTPLTSYLGAVVFSQAADARVDLVATVSEDPQMIMLRFVSESGTVNLSDGPLAALFFQLDEAVPPGSNFRLIVDEPNSLLLDPRGIPVAIEPREGVLTTRLHADPFRLQIDGDRVAPGETAELAVFSLEPFAISGGQIAVRYDSTIARGTPSVRMDPRHGPADFEADASTPGLILVNFSSDGGELNRIPGDLVQISLPISERVETSGSSPVWLDPVMTWVEGPPTRLLPVSFEDDLLEFVEGSDGKGRGSVSAVEINRSGSSATRTGEGSQSRGPARRRGSLRARY
jgi:hypothetical protein